MRNRQDAVPAVPLYGTEPRQRHAEHRAQKIGIGNFGDRADSDQTTAREDGQIVGVNERQRQVMQYG